MFFPTPANDPYYSNVSLLLPMEGANNSTTFTDASPTPKTITSYGDTKISTAQSKWGYGSGYFDGGGDYLTVTSADFIYGTGDFTWEVWMYGNSGNYLLDHGENTGLLAYQSNTVRYYNTTVGYDALYSNGGSLAGGTWNHLAVSRQSGTTRLFVNGTLKASQGDSYNYTGQTLTIGCYGGGGYNLTGYLQDLRITKGVARYTANFTPPGPLRARSYMPVAIPHFQPSAHLAAWRGL